MAAARLVDAGLRVQMLDVGLLPNHYGSSVPDRPFLEARRRDPNQARYLLGDRREGVPLGKQMVGALLTPPRQYVLEPTDSIRSPIRTSGDVEIRQSLALGGLGAAWGASCFTYSPAELLRMGLAPDEFPRLYSEVAAEIGVSGAAEDDCCPFSFSETRYLQPPVDLDANARRTMEAYSRNRAALNARGVHLGRSYLAVLTRDLGERRANPYFDLDFYHDHGESVYRPAITIGQLRTRENFTYSGGVIVHGFAEPAQGAVTVFGRDLVGGAAKEYRARALLLCAGSVNSARIAFGGLGAEAAETTFLNSPAAFFPCVNFTMLGRRPDHRRLSLAQISGILAPPDDPAELVSFQINHYSSLLLFKLVKEMPLPPWAGLLVARLLVSSLSIVGVYHADAPNPRTSLRLSRAKEGGAANVEIAHTPDPAIERVRTARERLVLSGMRKLRYVPLGAVRPKWGTSMHYAGTIPMTADGAASVLSTDGEYRLRGTRSVFVGDSSTWRYLPAKGLTFTIMANARRAAERVLGSLR